MKPKIDFEYGDPVYIKDDPEQAQMTFVGFIGRPGNLQYILDFIGEEYVVYDFQVSKESDIKKKLNLAEDI
jgi:hypothetical protein